MDIIATVVTNVDILTADIKISVWYFWFRINLQLIL